MENSVEYHVSLLDGSGFVVDQESFNPDKFWLCEWDDASQSNVFHPITQVKSILVRRLPANSKPPSGRTRN